MKVFIDTESRSLIYENNGLESRCELYSKQAFEIISQIWLKVGWNEKYPYTFSWLGRPIIQNPEDMIRAQEVVCRVRPDVIIETGVAHGGSLVFYARAMNKGCVIGVDIEILPSLLKTWSQKHFAIWGGGSKGVILSLLLQRAGMNVGIVIDIDPANQGKYNLHRVTSLFS